MIMRRRPTLPYSAIDTLLGCLAPSPSMVVFAGRPGMGKTSLMKELTIGLSARESVLYATYQDYSERLLKELRSGNGIVKENIMVNDSANYFHASLAEEFRGIAKESGCDTLILDDLEAMVADPPDYLQRNHFIHDLREVADELGIRIILCAPVSPKAEKRGGAMIPRLEDITWSRSLTVLADQLFALWRPEYYGVKEDEEGKPVDGRLDIYILKNVVQLKDNSTCISGKMV